VSTFVWKAILGGNRK